MRYIYTQQLLYILATVSTSMRRPISRNETKNCDEHGDRVITTSGASTFLLGTVPKFVLGHQQRAMFRSERGLSRFADRSDRFARICQSNSGLLMEIALTFNII